MASSSLTAVRRYCLKVWASRQLGPRSLLSICGLTAKALIAGFAIYLLITLWSSLPHEDLQVSLRWPSEQKQVNATVIYDHQPLRRTANERRFIHDAQIQSLPDARPTRCRNQTYDVDSMKRSATLVVPFSEYEFYDVEVTLASVFYDADPVDRGLLAEIILVDVVSSLKHSNVRHDVELYLENLKNSSELQKYHNVPVRLIRIDKLQRTANDGSHGHWPLEVGANAAQTDVVVFVRPGVIVGRGWLAPIVQPLISAGKHSSRTSAVESHIDRLKSLIDMDYQITDDDLVPFPSWSLAIQMRRIPFDSSHQKLNGSKVEVQLYRPVSVLRGSAFAMRKSELNTLGGMFDDGLDVAGGGEYLDLSLRLWMCGRGVKATCSRVGVPDIEDDIRVVSQRNARRLADTWFGSYRKLIAYFAGTFHYDRAAAGDDKTRTASKTNPTDTKSRLATLDRSQCKDFEWYLKTVTLDRLLVPRAANVTHIGILQVKNDHCARIGTDHRIDLDSCNADFRPQPDTVFEMVADGRILVSATGQCVYASKSNHVIIGECEVPHSRKQTWQLTKRGELISQSTRMCAVNVFDPDQRYTKRKIIMVQPCGEFDLHADRKAMKTWTFINS